MKGFKLANPLNLSCESCSFNVHLIKYEALKELLCILKVNNNLINSGKFVVDGEWLNQCKRLF